MGRSPEQVQIKGGQMTRKIEVERFSLVASKPFDEVVATINAAIGHPDMGDFWRSSRQTGSAAELEAIVRDRLGSAGLMLFMSFDHGSIIQKGTGSDGPRLV